MNNENENWVEDTLNQTLDVENNQAAETPKPSSAPKKAKKKKSAKGKVIFILILLLVIIGGAAFAGYENFALIGDISGAYKIYSRNVSEIDLSGSGITDFSGLSRMNKVEKINLTNTSFDNLSLLYDCESLETVILHDKTLPAKQCIEFYDLFPNASLICNISVGDNIYSSSAEQIDVSDSDMSEESLKLFAAVHGLKKLDLSKCTVSDNTYDYINSRLTECDILRKVNFNGSEYLSNVSSLVLTSDISQSEIERLKYFPQLEVVDIRQCGDVELADRIKQMYPQIDLNRSLTFLDVEVGTADEVIDLRGKKYSLSRVKAELEEKLQNFTHLKKIDMCGCGLTNAEMEELTNAYPEIKFVWIVKFGRWRVRTDAVVFSALNSNENETYDEKDYAPLLKYCTDLVALDLGHSLIKDISSISNLKKLRAVIFTDNKISDISAFAELKDLEFIEMNVNRIKSVEPLKDLNNLKYINIWSSKTATDLSPLYNHDSLELAIFHKTVPSDERQRFKESNPDCQTFFMVDINKNLSTNKAWRENPYRIELKKAFSGWKKVVGWSEETGFIFDKNTDQYSIK